jgi:hypothetical protein
VHTHGDMAMTQAAVPGSAPAGPAMPWCQVCPEDTAAHLGVDPATGLSASQAAALADKFGPDVLPAERPRPEWHRFVDKYRSCLQIILVVGASSRSSSRNGPLASSS